MKILRLISFLLSITVVFVSGAFAQSTGSIAGQITDSLGAVVVGASVTVVSTAGAQKQAVSNARGEYSINGLAPGKYTIKAIAPKFALYENTEVEVTSGERTDLIVVLTVGGVEENVEVSNNNTVSNDADNNASATILKEKDLDALPDDPDELEAALQAMAGAGAGPDGGQISIDGFTGGRMPPKEAIREVRINTNPFSAEYDRIGFGRIDILTRPGFDKFRGSIGGNFNDESLNSRNPFASNRAPSQTRNFNGFLSGPISAKKASFFLDVNQGSNDQNNVISADVLDGAGNIIRFEQDVRLPNRRFGFSPRIDYALNERNTLVGRYSFNRNTSENQGPGGFTLLSRATDSKNTQHGIQLTESMIVNSKTVNETRFQFENNYREQVGDNSTPSINVSGAFNGGGAQVGLNYTRTRRWEIQNYTTTSFGKQSQHAVKFGIRVRGINIEDRAENNYGGSFSFQGFAAPGGDPCDLNNDLLVSSLEQYRCKTLGRPENRYNPTQFSLTTGNPVASISQVDYSPFITNDWKVRKDFTLSLGLRYENQTNIKSNLNFAPRLGFAWSPGAGGAKAPKTVFRGGAGVFFDRVGEFFALRARRNDGVSQLQYTVTSNNPALLGQAVFSPNGTVTNVPTAAQVAVTAPLASIPYRIADDLSAPYSIQAAISVERQLAPATIFSATYINSRSLHTLRTRNINAPICPTVAACPAGLTTAQIQALRPDSTQGNVYRLESSGYAKMNMVFFNFRTTIRSKYNFNAGYTIGSASGDTDSLSSPRFVVNTVGFPAYSYDLSGEFGPSAFIARHQLFFMGSMQLPWGIRANPFVTASTGRRFNITSGVDNNYDSLFFERPTFALLNQRCQELNLTNSFCDMSDVTNMNAVIPRNYGKGPAFFTLNMNLSKTIGFGGDSKAAAASNQSSGGQGGSMRGGGPGGGGRGPGGAGGGGPQMIMMGGGGPMGGGGDVRKPYNLTIGLSVQNVLNNVNFNNPVSSLTSPSFGQYRSTGGGFGFFGGGGSANRRVELQLRFSF
jgi:hypothetical protein